jgi:hypothetical protein
MEEILTSPRRLDAAMPGRTAVGRPTELWVQICLPDSEGFRTALPQYTRSGEEITKGDVRENNLAVVFALDQQTGAPLPARLRVEPRAPDFTLDQSYQDIQVSPFTDSGLMTFVLTPRQARKRSIVHVAVKQPMPDGALLTLGSVSLTTQIVPTGAQLVAYAAWTLVSLTLSSFVAGPFHTEAAAASPSPPPRIHERVRVIDQVEREEIEEYLSLDEPRLHSLMPPYVKQASRYMPSGQIEDGRRIFEQLRPALVAKLCDESGICKELDDPLLADEVNLTVVIAELIAPIVQDIPPQIIAAIIVKIGVRSFCGCS